MRFTFTGAGPTTAPSQALPPLQLGSSESWHLYVSGVFGAAGAVAVQYSPDIASVTDAASRWFAPAALSLTAGGDTWFQARFRKLRVLFTGGDSTTAVVVEIV
jgi:hypothetical protein